VVRLTRSRLGVVPLPALRPSFAIRKSPMRRTLKLFIIPAGKSPGTPPEPGPELELESTSEDGLLEAAHAAIAERGERVRAVSFTPTGLVAYVEATS
jgi:hypothetical protein